jgi:hypothetical protein
MFKVSMRLAAIALASLGVVAAANASSIPAGTYDLNNVSVKDLGNNTFQLSGSVTLNASGFISAAEITLQDAALGNLVFTHVDSAGGPSGSNPVADYAYISNPGHGQLALYYLTSLDGSGDIDLCILSANNCNAYQASYLQIYNQSSFGYNLVDLNSGVLDPATTSSPSPTPEPGSLALLGTGMLALAGAGRRKFGRA